MKIIKKHLSSFLTGICSVLLSLLGFSCSSSQEEPDYPCMYGMPTGSFEIKGTVTDENGEDVVNAEIRVCPHTEPSYLTNLTDKTDAVGNYTISSHNILHMAKVVCIPEQGDLEPDSIVVELEYKDRDKYADTWYRGHAEKNVDFILKSKNKNKE
ncbi:MAG: radical SAM-associated putative lipoprotein [Muribaculaceae bacterium]|nr:radical SAM-associated putative lipoprotein [Muribaculaceae bacterium]